MAFASRGGEVAGGGGQRSPVRLRFLQALDRELVRLGRATRRMVNK